MRDGKFYTDGAAYEQFMGQWSRVAGEAFIDWLGLPPGLNWVDVGCGTGAFTGLILNRCVPRTVYAVDSSADQIAYARNTPVATRATFRVGDAQALPCADGEFDVAVMALVINFLANPAQAVSEMRRVVRPGGTLATYTNPLIG